ncbi:hypothetical protein [Microvirga zambiensis]|uniref:hypothetical protein n=1 Tax=Microvirga zambiensis TaxID=1402137 RepID=UPI001FE640E5|nr:hypothetical protein [Microvirga zambiensis]
MTQATEVIEHCGHQIRLAPAGLDWIAAVTFPDQRSTVIMAPDREAALNKAYEWINLQLAPDKTSE